MGFGVFTRILLFCLCLIMMVKLSFALVELEGGNTKYTFEDLEANFAPHVKTGGISGKLYIAEPHNACSPLTNTIDRDGNYTAPFALIIRGGCSFEHKVRNAQRAGFEAAIIYDNWCCRNVVTMGGNSEGIRINAIFVSKATGEKLKTFSSLDLKLWIIPRDTSLAWSRIAIFFKTILAISAVLGIYFFVNKHYVQRERPQITRVQEHHGMSGRLVKAMPSLVFTGVSEDYYCTSSACAICLEDYHVGDKLRVLPCRHKFHSKCVDSWLTTWRTFCPVCKHDAKNSSYEPPVSESTPLLSSNPSVVISSPSSSFSSGSDAIQIASPNLQSHVPCHIP